MRSLLRRFFSTFPFKYPLKHFKWYRKWYGGRWECWYIECCASSMWLDIKPPARGYPYGSPVCGRGTPEVEEYQSNG